MHASIELFRKLSDVLDATVLKADALARAEDVHPAIREVGAYGADRIALPKKLAELTAERPSADARILEKDEAVRMAAHAHKMCAEAIGRLRKTLAHNEKAAESEPETIAAPARTYAIGLALPASRRERVAQLRTDISAKEIEAAGLRRTLKNAKDALRRAEKRAKEVAEAIAATETAYAAHVADLERIIKLLRKTTRHLVHRIECRERRLARHEPVPAVTTDAAEPSAPAAPSDDDIRALAESNGLAVVTADDLEAARQLFA